MSECGDLFMMGILLGGLIVVFAVALATALWMFTHGIPFVEDADHLEDI